jgi:hypothetical protein
MTIQEFNPFAAGHLNRLNKQNTIDPRKPFQNKRTKLSCSARTWLCFSVLQTIESSTYKYTKLRYVTRELDKV